MKKESLTVDFKRMEFVETKESDIEIKELSEQEAHVANVKAKLDDLGFSSFSEAFKFYQENATKEHTKVVLIKKNGRVVGIAEKVGRRNYEINEIEFISLLSDLTESMMNSLGGV
jgi:hypothetical protein